MLDTGTRDTHNEFGNRAQQTVNYAGGSNVSKKKTQKTLNVGVNVLSVKKHGTLKSFLKLCRDSHVKMSRKLNIHKTRP